MLLCHTKSLLGVLTEAGSFGWLFKLKIYTIKSVIMVIAKQFVNFQKIFQRHTTASCQESRKLEKQNLTKESLFE